MAQDLLSSYRLHTAHVELTSACNLRCVYCPVSQPTYKPKTMTTATTVDTIFSILKARPAQVNINGHGETTIVEGWERIFSPLLESSIDCNLISNLSKSYSDNEIDALTKLSTLTISCDSLDPDTYQRLRRKGSIVNILITINRIRERCRELDRQSPVIGFSCVLGADNAHTVDQFISSSRQLGIHFIQFCHLTEYPSPPDANYTLKPLSELDANQLLMLEATLHENEEKNCPNISVQDGIYRAIKNLAK